MRHQTAVGVDPILGVGEIPVLDDPVEPFGAADENTRPAARQCVGYQVPGGLASRMAVEQFDVP